MDKQKYAFKVGGATNRFIVTALTDGRATLNLDTNYPTSIKHISQLVLGDNYLRLDYSNGDSLGVKLTANYLM